MQNFTHFVSNLAVRQRGLAIAAALTLSMVIGCQSVTKLTSTDPDSTLTVGDGREEVGYIKYADRKPMWGSLHVEVKKDGCRSKNYQISKFDEFSFENFLLALFTYGVATPWVTKYRSDYTLEFNCEKIDSKRAAR